MLRNWDTVVEKKPRKLKRRVWKGIPAATRGRVWLLLADGHKQMAANPGLYDDLAYNHHCPSKTEQQIRLDQRRTFVDHLFFRDPRRDGQQALFRVLRAYAVYNHKVGYCQGLSYVAGMFLCQYMEEEETFWTLMQFMNSPKYNMAGMFQEGFPLLHANLEIFETLLRHKYPKLEQHVQGEGILPIMYAEKWFITLFLYNWPYKVAVRIWDVFLYGGPKCLYTFALSVFEVAKDKLLLMPFEDLLTYLTNEFSQDLAANGVDQFMALAKKLKVDQSEIQKISEKSALYSF